MSRSLTQAELEAEGEALGRRLVPGELITFEGDLGAGKTTFIKAITRGLGVTQPATSPTYGPEARCSTWIVSRSALRMRLPIWIGRVWSPRAMPFSSNGPSGLRGGFRRLLGASGSTICRSRSFGGWSLFDVASPGYRN